MSNVDNSQHFVYRGTKIKITSQIERNGSETSLEYRKNKKHYFVKKNLQKNLLSFHCNYFRKKYYVFFI